MKLPPLYLNSLLETRHDDGAVSIRRVLYVDARGGRVATITVMWLGSGPDVQPEVFPKALPRWEAVEDVARAVEMGGTNVVLDESYHADLRSDSELTEASRAVRDARWSTVQLLAAAMPEVLESTARGKLVREVHIATGVARDKLHQWLVRYWQRGQVPNALLPDYEKSGARGKPRAPRSRKRGRPSALMRASGPPGMNITAADARKLEAGGRRFFERMRLPLREAYRRTMDQYYHDRIEFPNGIATPILCGVKPTYRQFCYWYQKARKVERELKARIGEKAFALRHRVVDGSSTHLSSAPGQLFLIDANIVDVHLLSSIDRSRIIGRPVLYVVIDHFSRMIVGFYVGLEGPSWIGAQMALYNAFTDKAAFGAKYGRRIAPGEWECYHVPGRIVADGGAEFQGEPSSNLVQSFGLDLSTLPPFRADWKALIEGWFKIANERMIHWQPGAVYKTRDRGDPDYRLDAVLTIEDFTRMMIGMVIWYNQHYVVRKQIPPGVELPMEEMATPEYLWNWGIERRAGSLRMMAPERVRANLLPEDVARITGSGIYVPRFKAHYTSRDERIQSMLLRNTGRKPPELKVSVDDRDVSQVFARFDRGREIVPLVLTAADVRFAGRTREEVLDDDFRWRVVEQRTAPARDQAGANMRAELAAVVRDARDRLEDEVGKGAKPTVKALREARAEEKRKRRAEEAFTRPSEFIPVDPDPEASDEGEFDFSIPM